MSISWGIIGVGDVCEVKSGPAFNLIEGSRLAAVMRRNGDLARDYAQRHNVPKWYDDADALIQDPDIDAVYIATPPDSHADYALKVAAAGKPVYVEKPMAKSYAECVTMIRACAQAGVPLFVAYYRRAMANFLAIKQWIAEGVIGEIRFVDIQVHKSLTQDLEFKNSHKDNWRTDPARSGGGYFHDLACHQLDIMDFIFGPIARAQGYHQNQAGIYAADDIVLGQFQFENGIPGQGSWCFTTCKAAEKEMTTIYGSKGTLSFPYFGDHSVTVQLDGQAPIRHTFDISKHIQHALIKTIVDELHGTGTCPSTGISAARTNQVIEWMIS